MDTNLFNLRIPRNSHERCVIGCGPAKNKGIPMHKPTSAALPSTRCTLGCNPYTRHIRSPCPGVDGGLLTRVDISHAFASSAADVAAPDKLTLTPLHVPDHMGVVSSATA